VGQKLKKNAQYIFYLHIFIYLIDREKGGGECIYFPTMIDYFSADNNSSFNENTRYPSSGPSQKLTISIFLGTVEAHFIQIMCEQRDISTPEVSVL
jgi:hypothetical protein